MADHDQLHRFTFENTRIRGEYVHLDATFQAALSRHDYPPVVANLLGQAMAASVLLGASVEFQGSLILQIQGNGPMTLLVVQIFADGSLRGMANWNDVELPETDHLQTLFDKGRLVITIETSKAGAQGQGERYQGIVDMGEGDLAEALQGYFRQSEQLETKIWLTVNEKHVAGLLIQVTPESKSSKSSIEAAIAVTEHDSHEENWNRINYLSSTITNQEMMGLPFRELIHRLYNEEDVRVFDPEIISFRCTCSRERIEKLLIDMGQSEVRAILEEQKSIEVDCEYCKQHYSFDSIDAERLFISDVSPDVTRTRH